MDMEKLKKILAELGCANATYDEIEMLVEAALPKKEIQSHLIILAIHLVKVEIYGRTTASWKNSISNSVIEIHDYNSRNPKKASYYYNFDFMKSLLAAKWDQVLTKVANESNDQFTIKALKKEVKFDDIWIKIEKALGHRYQ